LLWDPEKLFLQDEEAIRWGVYDPFSIAVRRFYFTDSDWEHVVPGGEIDPLLRVESSRENWVQLKHQFVVGQKNNDNIYSPFKSTERSGTVYLIQKAKTDHFKIGFTSGDPVDRLRNLQTGNSLPLTLFDTFPCVGITTERRLHEIFASARLVGEWFCLADMDIKNIMDAEWRVAQFIF
jgi:hypothetical protein